MIHRVPLFVLVALERDGRVLLQERRGTRYGDGWLVFPGGKTEPGENVVVAGAREAKEEIGVLISPEDLRLVHVSQLHTPGAPDVDTVAWFLSCQRWGGEPYNAEPDKCAGLRWVPVDELPERVWPHHRTALERWRLGEPFSLQGWD